jgi:uncharacterized membrane protein
MSTVGVTQPSVRSETSLATFLPRALGVVIVLAYLFLPWASLPALGDQSFTGSDLRTLLEAPPATGVFLPLLLTGIASILMGLLGIVDPSARKAATLGPTLFGVIGLLFVVLFFLGNAQATPETAVTPQIGVFVALAAVLGLIVQGAIPRPATIVEQRSLINQASLVVVVIAMMASGYLSYSKLSNAPMLCVQGGLFNCAVAENSAWSRFMGVPVAYLGFITHVVILTVLLLEPRVKFVRQYGVIALFGITLFGFFYHCYLTYIAAFVLRALCPWCLAAHSMMTLLFIMASIRMYRSVMSPAQATA